MVVSFVSFTVNILNSRVNICHRDSHVPIIA